MRAFIQIKYILFPFLLLPYSDDFHPARCIEQLPVSNLTKCISKSPKQMMINSLGCLDLHTRYKTAHIPICSSSQGLLHPTAEIDTRLFAPLQTPVRVDIDDFNSTFILWTLSTILDRLFSPHANRRRHSHPEPGIRLSWGSSCHHT